MRHYAFGLLVAAGFLLVGCKSDDRPPGNGGGLIGTGGSGGSGTGGTGGTATGGTGGTAGQAGTGGTGGVAGTAGDGGAAGSAGEDAGSDADLKDAPDPDVEPVEGSLGDGAIGDKDATQGVVCNVDGAAFNLGNVPAASTMPAAFVTAWNQERTTTEVPGLVIAFRGLSTGAVNAEVGAVHAVSQTKFAFDGAPNSTNGLPVIVDSVNPKMLTMGPLTALFVVSFGTDTVRRGFAVQKLKVEGEMSAECDEFTGLVTMTVPDSMTSQPFGGTTLGAALGPATVDLDNNGLNDAWAVRLDGTAGTVNVDLGGSGP